MTEIDGFEEHVTFNIEFRYDATYAWMRSQSWNHKTLLAAEEALRQIVRPGQYRIVRRSQIEVPHTWRVIDRET